MGCPENYKNIGQLMDTLLLFVEHIDDEGCLCIKINDTAEIIDQLKERTFDQIRQLQVNSKVLILETALNISFFELELAWLPERKARQAIPFALEEQLAQASEQLHYAFAKTFYKEGHYLIAVVNKQRLSFIQDLLQQNHINAKQITVDWFALQVGETIAHENNLLVNTSSFKGGLSDQLAEKFLQQHPQIQLLSFENSKKWQAPEDCRKINSYEYLAKEIQKKPFINLCQGDMQNNTESKQIKIGAYLCGTLFLLWLVCLLCVNAFNLYFINKKSKALDQKIAVIYYQFFPHAKQVISPRFRISQLLKGANQDEYYHFWILLDKFSQAMNKKDFKVEQMRYANHSLSISLISTDFAKLEQLEKDLKNKSLKVKQTQASSHDKEVLATLELS